MRLDRTRHASVADLLRAVRRRRTAVQSCVALTAGFGLWAATYITLRPVTGPVPASAVGAVVGLMTASMRIRQGRRDRTLAAAAVALERTHPGCHNLVITSEEIQRHPDRAGGWIAECVHADAAAATRELA